LNYIALDDFPPWSVYIPAIVALLAFLLALSMLLAALRRDRSAEVNKRGRPRSNRPLWFFTIASAAGLWFLVSSMLLRFHGVGIDRSRIELAYLWPEPPVVIDFSELIDIRLARAGRNCGHLEIATRQERYLSVNFRKCDNAEAVIRQIPLRNQR